MKKKNVFTFGMTVCLTLAAAFNSFAGWEQVGDSWAWKYKNEDGSYAVNQWKEAEVKGYWYYVGSDGFIVRDSIIDGEYYVGIDGIRRTNWWYVDDDFNSYFFDSDGKMLKNTWCSKETNDIWYFNDNCWYYVGADGRMLKNTWHLDTSNNNWYYFDSEGIMQTGWLDWNGKKYYLRSDGIMVTGCVQVGGELCLFLSDGSLQESTEMSAEDSAAAFLEMMKNK